MCDNHPTRRCGGVGDLDKENRMSEEERSPSVHELSIHASGTSGETIDVFFDACAPVFAVELADRADNTAFSVSLKGVQLGALVVSDAHMTGGRYHYRRDLARIASTGLDLMLVQIMTGGSDTRLVGGQELRSRPGDVFVADLTRTMRTCAETCSNFSFVLPRAAFGLREAELDHFHDRHLPAGGVAATVLGNHVRSLWEQRRAIRQSDTPGLSAATAGLLGGLLAHDPVGRREEAGEWSPKYLQICQYIDRNLGDHDLDPDHLARRFNVSRAVLYRLFTRSDGVANYIRERRLRQAFRQLVTPGHATVATIGFSCGFQSPSSFIRAFKARYGMTPGETFEAVQLREPGRHEPENVPESSLPRLWLEQADR